MTSGYANRWSRSIGTGAVSSAVLVHRLMAGGLHGAVRTALRHQ
jgi:hypothetical protein